MEQRSIVHAGLFYSGSLCSSCDLRVRDVPLAACQTSAEHVFEYRLTLALSTRMLQSGLVVGGLTGAIMLCVWQRLVCFANPHETIAVCAICMVQHVSISLPDSEDS